MFAAASHPRFQSGHWPFQSGVCFADYAPDDLEGACFSQTSPEAILTGEIIGVAWRLTLMGMESPDTRRKADDSYRAR
jgi:hypothetical protein